MAHPRIIKDGTPVLYKSQASPVGLQPTILRSATDLLVPPYHTPGRLGHFFDGLYDLRPESHISRMLKVLLGDNGLGQLRKLSTYIRLSSTLTSSHFYELDRFWGAIFGVRRRLDERMEFDPVKGEARVDQWVTQDYRDGSYRTRIEQFAKAVHLGPTPIGLEAIAEALLNVDCDVFESWVEVDRTGGDPDPNRYVATIRPKRPITAEEHFDLHSTLQRVKPANIRLTVEPTGVLVYVEQSVNSAWSPSAHWEVKPRVVTPAHLTDIYLSTSDAGIEQPRPAFAGYQGEAWSYLNDVNAAVSYVESDEGQLDERLTQTSEQGIINDEGEITVYRTQWALQSLQRIVSGRMASDGVMVSSGVVEGQRQDTRAFEGASG